MDDRINFPEWNEELPLEDYTRRTTQIIAETPQPVVLATLKWLLEAFIAENFTGPPCPPSEPIETMGTVGAILSQVQHKQCLDALLTAGETVHPAVRRPFLLVLAHGCADNPPLSSCEKDANVLLWRLRTYTTYQRVMSRKASTLRQKLDDCVKALQTREPTEVRPAQVHLEIAYVYDMYRDVDLCTKMVNLAKYTQGLEVNVSGFMGVRTEHQEFKTAQLVVHTTSAAQAEPTPEVRPRPPRIIQSEDCNVFQRPSTRNLIFRETAPDDSPDNLSVLDQAIMLGLCLNVRNNNPAHGLTNEEMQPYIERILACSNTPWVVLSATLLLKARIELHRSRVMERGLLQIQELMDGFLGVGEEEQPPPCDKSLRIKSFFLVPYPSYPKLGKELSRHYLGLGMHKTAETLAESLHDWEFVVLACQRQGNHKRAEKIARELIEKDPTNPAHWCALAEATMQKEPYFRAWELSKHRSAHAMRGLARIALERKEYHECIEYFDKALALNPVYGANWFQLGYSCMQTNNLPRALSAFTRVVQLDPNDGQAWNNLGTVYLKSGNKEKALHAIGEAMRLMEYSWQVKENHMHIAIELDQYQTAMADMNDLLEQKGHNYKFHDEAIDYLVDGLVDEVKALPAADDSSLSLRSRVEKFITKLHGTYTDSATIYAACARYYHHLGNDKQALTFHLKEHRATCLVSGWTSDMVAFQRVCKAAKSALQCSMPRRVPEELQQVLLVVKNTIQAAEQNFAKTGEFAELLEAQRSIEETLHS